MFKVMWWNKDGNASISESMRKDQAIIFLDSMLPEQQARLVYVTA